MLAPVTSTCKGRVSPTKGAARHHTRAARPEPRVLPYGVREFPDRGDRSTWRPRGAAGTLPDATRRNPRT